MTGSAASNVMDGGPGDDTLSGLNGNNIMVAITAPITWNLGSKMISWSTFFDLIVGSLQGRLESIMISRSNFTDGTINLFSNTITTSSPTYLRLVGDTNLVSTDLLQTVFNDQAWTEGSRIQSERDIETIVEHIMKLTHGVKYIPRARLQIDLTASNI